MDQTAVEEYSEMFDEMIVREPEIADALAGNCGPLLESFADATVCIVSRGELHEGGTTLGVFARVDRARRFVREYVERERGEWEEEETDRWTCGCDVVEIEEQDVLEDWRDHHMAREW